jgi:hypothetical protein
MVINGSLIPNENNMVQAQIKQDIAINTKMTMRGILLIREDHIAFLQKECHSRGCISQSYQEHSYASHEHHKQNHNLISSIPW